jgi:hypothetical protein
MNFTEWLAENSSDDAGISFECEYDASPLSRVNEPETLTLQMRFNWRTVRYLERCRRQERRILVDIELRKEKGPRRSIRLLCRVTALSFAPPKLYDLQGRYQGRARPIEEFSVGLTYKDPALLT